MVMFCRIFIVVLGLAAALNRSVVAVSFTEDFSSNPFAPAGNWSFGIGASEPSTNRFVWNSSAPPAYSGDAIGELEVHLNSSLPTVRFQRPLGITLTDTNDFLLKSRFSFKITSDPDDQVMQIAFGLVNSALTGGDRTGTSDDFGSDNTFHTIEFDYFPNVSDFFLTGPTLTPTVLGGQKNGADGFANFASIFGSDSYLGDNTNGVTALPQSVTLEASLAYNAGTKTLTLTVSEVNSNGTLTLLDTGLPPMSLVALGYDTNFPLVVNALAIMAYQDGFTTTNDPSLVADITFQRFSFYAPPPEPPHVAINIVNTDAVLTFPTTSNFVYEIQSRTDLSSGDWSTIASNIAGTDGIVTNIHLGAAISPRRFYRVGVTAP
jgi:hypothetical protein